MCGIFAGSGKLDTGILTSLGCQNEKRGDDSSGLAWALPEKVMIQKVAERASVAFPLLLKDAVKDAGRSRAMIGHTRMASTGKVNVTNAHPFIEDGIAYAHNGVITNYDSFNKKGRKYEVDSQCLIYGIKDRNFSKFIGSIALIWLENNKLHAYRKGNPLYRGRKGHTTYLASEKSMLARVGCKKIKELTEGMLYVFDNGQITQTQKLHENKTLYSIGNSKVLKQEYAYENEEYGYYWIGSKRHYGKIPWFADAIGAEGKDQYNADTPEDDLTKAFEDTLRSNKLHSLTDKEWTDRGGV